MTSLQVLALASPFVIAFTWLVWEVWTAPCLPESDEHQPGSVNPERLRRRVEAGVIDQFHDRSNAA